MTVAVIMLCIAALMLYTTRMEHKAFSTVLIFLYMLLFSRLLFADRMDRLFFYTVSCFSLETAVGLIVATAVHSAVVWQDMTDIRQVYLRFLLLAVERGIQLAICWLMIRMVSSRKEKCNRKQYFMLSMLPVISCVFTFWIYASGIVTEQDVIAKRFVIVLAVGSFLVNSTMVYLAGEIARIMADNRLFGIEAKHYRNMDELHEQYDVFLHDIKHTMKTIAALAEEDNSAEIEDLIRGMQISLGNMNQKIICSHKILNALLAERAGYAKDNDVTLDFMIKEPLYLQEIENLDLVTLMGNLLDNAIAAEMNSKKREGILCSMWMARSGRHVLIQVENSYDEKASARSSFGKERTAVKEKAPIGAKHGIGLASVREIVEKYGGIMENSRQDGRYRVKIILTAQSGLAGYPAGSVQEINIG